MPTQLCIRKVLGCNVKSANNYCYLRQIMAKNLKIW